MAINCTEIVGNIHTRARGRVKKIQAVNGVKRQETAEKCIVAEYILCIIGNTNKNKDLQRNPRRGHWGVYTYVYATSTYFSNFYPSSFDHTSSYFSILQPLADVALCRRGSCCVAQLASFVSQLSPQRSTEVFPAAAEYQHRYSRLGKLVLATYSTKRLRSLSFFLSQLMAQLSNQLSVVEEYGVFNPLAKEKVLPLLYTSWRFCQVKNYFFCIFFIFYLTTPRFRCILVTRLSELSTLLQPFFYTNKRCEFS